MNTYLVLHIFACFFMTGVIWIVQILVYPNFRIVPPEAINQFHDHHSRQITRLVAPVMTLEFATGIILYLHDAGFGFFVNLGSILALWGLTIIVSVPLHNKISKNTAAVIEKLIATNWARTIIWSARSIFWLYFLWLN